MSCKDFLLFCGLSFHCPTSVLWGTFTFDEVLYIWTLFSLVLLLCFQLFFFFNFLTI